MKPTSSIRHFSPLASIVLAGALTANLSAQSIYFDVSNNTAGFGSASGSYNSNTAVWNTNSDGSGANLAAWPGGGNYSYTGIMTFGAAGSDFAGNTFTLNYNANGGVGGIVVNSTSANVTIGGTANLAFTQNGSLSVAAGSTLNITNVFGAISGINWNQKTMTLSGGGTINFNTSVVANGGTANQNDTNLTVNLKAAFHNSGTQTYTLTAGNLNFATAASTNAFRNNFNINGGIIDNTSGSAMTVAVPSTFGIGGDFTFTGSSDLAINKAVALAATREITVTENKLTLGGAISGASGGLTKNGDGTLELSGSGVNTSTYAGATLVSAGTLLVSGTLGNTAVTVDSNGTIGGSGTLGGTLTFNAGGNLDLTGAALGEASTGILTVDATKSITLNNFAFADIIGWNAAAAAPGTYTLINGGSSVTLSGDTPTESDPFDFGNGKQGYFQAGSLQAVIIPEPRAALLGGLGLLALLRRRRNG